MTIKHTKLSNPHKIPSNNKAAKGLGDWRSKPRKPGGGRKSKVDEAFRLSVVDGAFRVIKAYSDHLHERIKTGDIDLPELRQGAQDLQAFALKHMVDRKAIVQWTAVLDMSKEQAEALVNDSHRNLLIQQDLRQRQAHGEQRRTSDNVADSDRGVGGGLDDD